MGGFFYFGRGCVVGVEDGGDLVQDGVQVGPGVGIFFGVDDGVVKADLEGADLRVEDVLVGLRVDVLVLCDFEGEEVGGDHVADDLEVGEAFGDKFGNWVGRGVRLRKVSWYLASSWWVHQLCV